VSRDYSRTAARFRDVSDETYQQALDRIVEARRKDADAGGPLFAGTRVLDLTSGIDGVVLERTASERTSRDAVPVRLETGDVVERFARQLLARPTPPSA
jgi:hypothetical protein